MLKERVRNTSAVINILVIFITVVKYLFGKTEINLEAQSEIVFVVLLILGGTILSLLAENSKYYIFLLGTLNVSLVMLFGLIAQISSEKLSFITEEKYAILLTAILLLANNNYIRKTSTTFMQVSILFFFLVTVVIITAVNLVIGLSSIVGERYSLAIVVIFIVITVVTIIVSGIWGKMVSNVETCSEMIGILYACIMVLGIIATSFKLLNWILVLLTPSVVTIFVMYVFRKEILKIFGEVGLIVLFFCPLIMLSLLVAICIQLYSDILLYKIFIAVLLSVTAFLLLIISDDNIKIVMNNKKLDILSIERKFVKVRMIIGNLTIFLTIVSVIVDNFYSVFDIIDSLEEYRGIIFVFAIWLLGTIFSEIFMHMEKKILKAIIKVMIE